MSHDANGICIKLNGEVESCLNPECTENISEPFPLGSSSGSDASRCAMFIEDKHACVSCGMITKERIAMAEDETIMCDGYFSSFSILRDHFPKRLLAGQCGLLPWVGPEGGSENTLLLPCVLGLSAGVSLVVVSAARADSSSLLSRVRRDPPVAGQTVVWGATHVAVAEFETGAEDYSLAPYLRFSNVVSTSTVFTVFAAYRDTSSGAHWQPALSSEHVGRMRV
jgi:hypothetical protein